MQLNDGTIARALRTLAALRRDRNGSTAIEYSLIIALIALAIVTAAVTLGVNLGDSYTAIGTNAAWGH